MIHHRPRHGFGDTLSFMEIRMEYLLVLHRNHHHVKRIDRRYDFPCKASV